MSVINFENKDQVIFDNLTNFYKFFNCPFSCHKILFYRYKIYQTIEIKNIYLYFNKNLSTFLPDYEEKWYQYFEDYIHILVDTSLSSISYPEAQNWSIFVSTVLTFLISVEPEINRSNVYSFVDYKKIYSAYTHNIKTGEIFQILSELKEDTTLILADSFSILFSDVMRELYFKKELFEEFTEEVVEYPKKISTMILLPFTPEEYTPVLHIIPEVSRVTTDKEFALAIILSQQLMYPFLNENSNYKLSEDKIEIYQSKNQRIGYL